jgi:hypothetical protein
LDNITTSEFRKGIYAYGGTGTLIIRNNTFKHDGIGIYATDNKLNIHDNIFMNTVYGVDISSLAGLSFLGNNLVN